MYLSRIMEKDVLSSMTNNPVTAITGPRQCGKSTLVKHLMVNYEKSIYLDLESPRDLSLLADMESFLSRYDDHCICIDEVQRKPQIFPVIRSLVDKWSRNGSFLILGSASRDLLKQSSETLAGRISYKQLTPFLWQELPQESRLENYITFGAFPRSFFSKNAEISYQWRDDFISTFLERDLLQWEYFTPATMRRLWTMLAHLNGQTVNYSSLSNSLGITNVKIKSYIDLLASTFMVYIIPPYLSNLGKRMVKSPKVYISDSGITNALLGLERFEDIYRHPAFGAVWEQIVLSNLKGLFPKAEFYFYRTSHGAEIDFVMVFKGQVIAIECKASAVPSLSQGNYNAIEDIRPVHTFVITQTLEKRFPLKEGIDVLGIGEIKTAVENL